jgi:GDP-4-dehydro-6-deoxy-D-mannose reductase
MGKRVLITGITGMIGTHLGELFVQKGYEVAGISRATSASRWNLEKYDWKHYPGDILDTRFLNKVWSDFQPDWVFHLAAQAYNGLSWEAEDTTYALNIQGTRNVFNVTREITPQARLIPACSSAEYGFVSENLFPIDEDRTPLHPITPYGVSKACTEMMAHQFNKNFGLDVVIPRLFIHVGPNHPPATALQSFAMQLAEIKLGLKEPVLRVGNLNSARDFVDVRDGVGALYILAEKGESGQVYNVATGKAWNIGKCLNMLIEISGTKARVEHDPNRLRPSDEALLLGKWEKLEKLGWKPEIPFERTLKDIFLNWMERLKA